MGLPGNKTFAGGNAFVKWLNLNLFRILGLRQLCDNPVTFLAYRVLGPEGIV